MHKKLNEKIVPLLCCPVTRESLTLNGGLLRSESGKEYPIIDGIPAFAYDPSPCACHYEVSVLILALNEERNIGAVVTEVVKELQKLAVSFEVVVIDGDSTDRTREVAANAGARVQQCSPGYAEALIQGIKSISADISSPLMEISLIRHL